MIAATLMILGLIVFIWIALQLGGRGWPQEPVWRSGLLAGSYIGAARLVILWAAILLLGGEDGGHQIGAHMMIVLVAVVELGFVKGWINEPAKWRLLLTISVAISSIGLGLILAYMANRLRDVVAENA